MQRRLCVCETYFVQHNWGGKNLCVPVEPYNLLHNHQQQHRAAGECHATQTLTGWDTLAVDTTGNMCATPSIKFTLWKPTAVNRLISL